MLDQEAPFPLGLTLDLHEELLDSTVPYTQLSAGWQSASWCVNESSCVA